MQDTGAQCNIIEDTNRDGGQNSDLGNDDCRCGGKRNNIDNAFDQNNEINVPNINYSY